MSNESTKVAVQQIIQLMMDRVMDRVLVKDPFDRHAHRANKPLYAALVPDEIFKGSHFERRFVTPFGHAWEDLAVAVAKQKSKIAQSNYMVRGVVKEGRLRNIAEVLNGLEHPERGQSRIAPDWNSELAYVLQGKGKDTAVAIVCDVYVFSEQTNKRQAFELKSPTPNSDISKVSKEKMLKLCAMNPPQIDEAYFALPFNPYGERANYSWSFPERWFRMKSDPVVLIGDEFWNKIGGDGTYEQFVDAINEIGLQYKERIYREYLGLEPPPDFDEGRL